MYNIEPEQLQQMGLDALIRQAAQSLNDPDPSDGAPHPAWAAIYEMRRRGSRTVLDAAAQLCRSGDPRSRQVGALVLGQLGMTDGRQVPPYWQEQVHELLTLLNREMIGQNDPAVLRDVSVSLGHLNDVRAVPPLLKLLRHRNAQVRYGVAAGLTGHDDPRAIDGLIELSGDYDDMVREWATFGLQVIQVDTPAIRNALFARLRDQVLQIRAEAILGLAQRRDSRMLPVLREALNDEQVHPYVLQAAALVADHNFCEQLLQAAKRADGWDGQAQEQLVAALRACQC